MAPSRRYGRMERWRIGKGTEEKIAAAATQNGDSDGAPDQQQ